MLSLVKNDRSKKTNDFGVPEEFKERYPYVEPERLKQIYDFSFTPLGDILGCRNRKKKKLKAEFLQ